MAAIYRRYRWSVNERALLRRSLPLCHGPDMSTRTGFRRARAACLSLAAVLFASSAGALALRIPFDMAPDEWTHDYYNVRFLLSEGRLPRPGLDDRSAFETANSAPAGRAVARYSYTIAPALNYVLYAGAGWIGPRLLGIDRITSERFLSVFWGVVFLLGVYGASRSLGATGPTALAAATAAAFIPQVQFVSAYVSQDAYALAASAVAIWAVVHDARVATPRSFALAGAVTGWVLTCRLNYWVLLPCLGLWALWRLAGAPAFAGARRTLGAVYGMAVLGVSGFWLGRVVLTTGSLTGLGRALEEMRRVQGVTIEPAFDAASLRALLDRQFIATTFRSAFMTFDYMSLLLPKPEVYSALEVALAGLAACAGAVIALRRDRLAARAAIALAALASISAALHVYNSIFWDFQPQGRYLFPLVAPAAVFFAWLSGRHPVLRPGLLVFAAGMLVLTFETQRVVSRAYAGIDPGKAARVRRLPIEARRGPFLQRWLTVPRGGWRGVELERVDAVAYDVAFYGLEVLDAETDAPLRTAYVTPRDWRRSERPVFRFRALPESEGRRYRLRLFAEQPGISEPAFRMEPENEPGAAPASVPAGRSFAVRLLY